MEAKNTFSRQKIIKPMRIIIRPARREEWDDAMALAWRTFMKFEAEDYTDKGIKNFQDFITDPMLHRMFDMGAYRLFVAYDNDKIVGMISLRNDTHISLLFVDEKYHKMGIGRMLMNYLCQYVVEEGYNLVTVNAAPYAVEFYHRVGFIDAGKEEFSDGIIYTPMKRIIG